MGYFTGKGANVFLKKHTNGTTLAFVVTDGTWNNAQMVTQFETITRTVAPTIGGLPIDMRLMSTTLVVEKDEKRAAVGATQLQSLKQEPGASHKSSIVEARVFCSQASSLQIQNNSCNLRLRLGCRRRLAIVLVRAALGLQLLELLLLCVVQHGFDFGVRVLHEGMDLGVAILLSERSIRAKDLHLLEAICKDGLDLRRLVVAQAQALAETRGLPVGVEVAVEVAVLRRCGLRPIGRGGWLAAGICANTRPAESSGLESAWLFLYWSFVHLLNSPCGCLGADRPLRV